MNRDQTPRVIDKPQPCFVRMKMVKHGPWVGARIFTRFGILSAEINGIPADPFQVWHGGEFINESRYDILMRDARMIDPYIPVHQSDLGLTDRVREAAEADYWWRP